MFLICIHNGPQAFLGGAVRKAAWEMCEAPWDPIREHRGAILVGSMWDHPLKIIFSDTPFDSVYFWCQGLSFLAGSTSGLISRSDQLPSPVLVRGGSHLCVGMSAG